MNKTVLITGATGGIGSATAVLFAQNGYNVAIAYHHAEKKAKDLCERLCANGLQAAAFGADVAVRDEAFDLVRRTEETFGSIDVLVNNAGISQFGLFTDLSQQDWRAICGTNLDGSIFCAQAAAKSMVRRQSGVIINTASMWGEVGASCEVAYSVTKAALIGLTKALAKELGPSNIRVNCVSPGMIDTEMNRRLTAEDVAALAEETPLGRVGTPQEVAQTTLFLASAQASFITGQVLSCNGGFIM